MKRILSIGLAVVSLGVIFGVLHVRAEDQAVGKMRALFAQSDRDHNQSLSRDEQAAALQTVEKNYGARWEAEIRAMFAEAADADGNVSAAGWKQAVADYEHGTVPAKQTFRIPKRSAAPICFRRCTRQRVSARSFR